MTEDQKPTTADQLFAGILEGKVPHQVRLFAAQGLLPVPREDLLRLQVVLTSDPDTELAAAATESLNNEDKATLVEWLGDGDLPSLVLDLLTRVRREPEIWSAVAIHENVSDETLRVLARHGGPLLQDIIITNQVRLLGCLEILDDLRANVQVNQVVLRRVHEFEEEFIQKALAEEDDLNANGPSVDEALTALRLIGAHIPKEDVMPYPKNDDPALEDAIKKSANKNTHARLLKMSVHERIVCAIRGTKEERAVLVNSRNRLIQRSVLACPKLTDIEVERYASSRSVAEEVIRMIAENRRWLRQYPVVVALALNPKTPVYTANKLIPRLSHRDKARLSRDRNVSPVVRQMALKMLDTRR